MVPFDKQTDGREASGNVWLTKEHDAKWRRDPDFATRQPPVRASRPEASK